jgi:anti-anti-sigma regulatory factor
MKNDRNGEIVEKNTIILEGSLTIQKIGELKETITQSLSDLSAIVIDHSAGEAFDFSYLQLLCSVRNTLKGKKIDLSIRPYNPLFKKLYNESGFDSTALATNLKLTKENSEERK